MLEWEGGDAEAFLTMLDVGGSECQAPEYLSLLEVCELLSMRETLIVGTKVIHPP